MQFEAILCDIDGCLTDEAGGPLNLEALARVAAFNRWAEQTTGASVLTVCTGRPLPFAEAICRLVHNNSLPLVAENGVWLYHPATNAYGMDPAIGPDHLDAIAGAARLLDARYRGLGVTQQPSKSASVTLYHRKTSLLHGLVEEVRGVLADRGWPIRVSTTWHYINCDLDFVNKATGIRRFLDATGIDPARCAGIGDTLGDALIADSVAWFACPANADPALKPRAAYVSPCDQADGVVDILERVRRGPPL